MDLGKALTESANPASQNLDRMSSLEIIQLMNTEDLRVLEAAAAAAPVTAHLVDALVERFARGGRLFYIGAGTSGRLGVLDASECPPTFGTPPELVQGIIAGGMKAFSQAVEKAEDNPEAGAEELKTRGFGPDDVLVGISASGRTPFVMGAVAYARGVGAVTGGIFCNPGSPLESAVDFPILLEVGPEVVTGSTRLKAGTATKLVLNQITTAAMVGSGRVLGNLMVDLMPACEKLEGRSLRILSQAAGLSELEADGVLTRAGGDLKLAILMASGGLEAEPARKLLEEAGDLRLALERARS